MRNSFTKYLKKSCLLSSYQLISFKYFPNIALNVRLNIKIIVRLLFGAVSINGLTLSMLRLLLSIGEKCKKFWKPSKPCHVGIHWKALTEYTQMSTHMPWFQSFSAFLHDFVLAKLATSSIRVKIPLCSLDRGVDHCMKAFRNATLNLNLVRTELWRENSINFPSPLSVHIYFYSMIGGMKSFIYMCVNTLICVSGNDFTKLYLFVYVSVYSWSCDEL